LTAAQNDIYDMIYETNSCIPVATLNTFILFTATCKLTIWREHVTVFRCQQ